MYQVEMVCPYCVGGKKSIVTADVSNNTGFSRFIQMTPCSNAFKLNKCRANPDGSLARWGWLLDESQKKDGGKYHVEITKS